jgi:hypothetical protein
VCVHAGQLLHDSAAAVVEVLLLGAGKQLGGVQLCQSLKKLSIIHSMSSLPDGPPACIASSLICTEMEGECAAVFVCAARGQSRCNPMPKTQFQECG